MGNKDSKQSSRFAETSAVRKEEHTKEFSGGPATRPYYGGAYKHEEKHKEEVKTDPYGGKREVEHKEYTSHQGHL